MRAVVLMMVVAGCGFSAPGGDHPDRPDGTPPIDGAVDGDDAGPTDGGPLTSAECHARWLSEAGPEFLAPVPIASANTMDDDLDVTISRGTNRLYWSAIDTLGGEGNDIFSAEIRPDEPSIVDGVTLEMELSTAQDDTKVTISDDGTYAVVSQDVSIAGAVDYDLQPFDLVNGVWKPAVQFPLDIDNNKAQLDPAMSGDALTLYFSDASIPMFPAQSIVVSRRTTRQDTWGMPMIVRGMKGAMPTRYADPSPAPDGTFLLYATRAFNATNANIAYSVFEGGMLGPERLIPTLNTDTADNDPIVTSDYCGVYFASKRAMQAGTYDIYYAAMKP